MGQINSSAFTNGDSSPPRKANSRPFTYSDDVGPTSRARAMVAQAQAEDPLAALLARFYEKLAAAIGEPYSPLRTLRSPRTLASPLSSSASSPGLGGRPTLARGGSFRLPPLLPAENGNYNSNKLRRTASMGMADVGAATKALERYEKRGGGREGEGDGERWRERERKKMRACLDDKEAVSAALREYDWLLARLEKTEARGVPAQRVKEVYVAGLACWLEFWRQWGDGPPKDESSVDSNGPFSGKNIAKSEFLEKENAGKKRMAMEEEACILDPLKGGCERVGGQREAGGECRKCDEEDEVLEEDMSVRKRGNIGDREPKIPKIYQQVSFKPWLVPGGGPDSTNVVDMKFDEEFPIRYEEPYFSTIAQDDLRLSKLSVGLDLDLVSGPSLTPVLSESSSMGSSLFPGESEEDSEDEWITEIEVKSERAAGVYLSPRAQRAWMGRWTQVLGQAWTASWGERWLLGHAGAKGGLDFLLDGEAWGGSFGSLITNLAFLSPNEGKRLTFLGKDCSLQEFLLQETLLNDRTLSTPPSRSEVLRILGLAVAISEWEPTSACLCMLRLLNRLGRFSGAQEMKQPREQDEGAIEFRAARKFVLACLLDVLDYCGVAGVGPTTGLVGPTGGSSRCRLAMEMAWASQEATVGGTGVDGRKRESDTVRVGREEEEEEEMWREGGTSALIEKGKDVGRKKFVLYLSELAELTIADSLFTGTPGLKRNEICQEADKLYRQKKAGPGVTAVTLATFLQELPRVWPSDVLRIAAKLEEIGCSEAAFRARIRATASTHIDAGSLRDIVTLVFQERGYESVPSRVGRLFAAANSALNGAPSYTERYLYARRFSSALLKPLTRDPCHPWGSEIAQTFLRISGELGPMEGEEAALHQLNVNFCARLLAYHLVKSLPRSERAGELQRWIERNEDPGANIGWLAWKAIGDLLEKADQLDSSVQLMWAKAVTGTYTAVNQEGTSVDREALELFDWGLQAILVGLPPSDCSPAALLRALDLGPANPKKCGRGSALLLAAAARMSSRIYWRWPNRRDTARFVARLLRHAHEEEGMNAAELEWAIAIATRLWGWTLPSRDAVSSKCQDSTEAKEIMDAAMVELWTSVAAFEGEGPLTCVGENWPF